MSRDPIDDLGIALDHLSLVEQYQERADVGTALVFDALCMRLSAAIEALTRVPEEWLLSEFGERWREIRATRNVIAHVYDQVDEQRIHHVVSHSLPWFIAGVHRLVDRHAPGLRPEPR